VNSTSRVREVCGNFSIYIGEFGVNTVDRPEGLFLSAPTWYHRGSY
jgi:hypothetical protein